MPEADQGAGSSGRRGQDDEAGGRSAGVLTAAEGRDVPGPSSGQCSGDLGGTLKVRCRPVRSLLAQPCRRRPRRRFRFSLSSPKAPDPLSELASATEMRRRRLLGSGSRCSHERVRDVHGHKVRRQLTDAPRVLSPPRERSAARGTLGGHAELSWRIQRVYPLDHVHRSSEE